MHDRQAGYRYRAGMDSFPDNASFIVQRDHDGMRFRIDLGLIPFIIDEATFPQKEKADELLFVQDGGIAIVIRGACFRVQSHQEEDYFLVFLTPSIDRKIDIRPSSFC